jgi:hypothetical protein
MYMWKQDSTFLRAQCRQRKLDQLRNDAKIASRITEAHEQEQKELDLLQMEEKKAQQKANRHKAYEKRKLHEASLSHEERCKLVEKRNARQRVLFSICPTYFFERNGTESEKSENPVVSTTTDCTQAPGATNCNC